MRVLMPLVAVGLVAGCARWEPRTEGPVEFTRACPLKRAPAVEDFGDLGVTGAYHFVIQDAPKEDLAAFLQATGEKSFSVALMPIEINGMNTIVAQGPGVLGKQAQVDAEFELACGIGRGKVYLTHVRYDPYDPKNEGWIRVR